jgi:signal transduction histidine kinase
MFDINRHSRLKVTSFRIFPVLEGGGVGLFALIAITVSAYFIYARALDALRGEIKEGLLRNVAAAATTIDGDLHRTFVSKSQKNDPQYVEFLRKLEAIRQASKHVRYLYTNIIIGDKIYFIANPSPQNDNDHDGKPDEAPELMDPYPDAGEALRTALTKHVVAVDREPYTDQWGTFYSAYAPFYDKSGHFVGTLGMDLELTSFNERLAPIVRATKRAAITGIVLAILWGTSIWFTRRFSVQLDRSRQRLATDLRQASEYAANAAQIKSEFTSQLSQGALPAVRAILTTTDPITSEPPVSNPKEQAAVIRKNATLLEQLLTEAAEHAALESGQQEMENQDFRLSSLVDQVIQRLTPAAQAKSISLKTSISEELPEILHGDPSRLRELLTYLTEAAIATGGHAPLLLDFGMHQEMIHHVKLRITLEGAGVSVSKALSLDEFFDAFAYLDREEDEMMPSLKLAITRRLITLMKGDVLPADPSADRFTLVFFLLLKKSQASPEEQLASAT